MKIVQISIAANIGSQGKIASQIGRLVVESGGESFIAFSSRVDCKRKDYSEQIPVGNRLSFLFHVLVTRLLDRHGLASCISTRRLISKIRFINPDIIHLHNIHGYWLNYELLFEFLKDYGKPIVWTLHDGWAFTGHCSHFDAANCYQWKNGCEKCPQKKKYPKSLFLDRSKQNYELKKRLFTSVLNMIIVPVSHYMGDMAKQSFLSKYPINVICNGVDLKVFHPVDSNLRESLGLESKFVILGVATMWTNSKGLGDYMRLASLLSSDYQIILIGIPESLRKTLPSNVIAIEKTFDQHSLVEYYSMADVVANLSYQESFGLTTVEGLACGTPGIVYNKTASPELVDSGCGMVLEAGNIEQLISCLETMKSQGKQYYSTNCVNRARLLYDNEVCFSNYLDLYKKMLKA